MRPARFERATSCFVGKRSIQLSYGRIGEKLIASKTSFVAQGLLQRLSESVNEA